MFTESFLTGNQEGNSSSVQKTEKPEQREYQSWGK